MKKETFSIQVQEPPPPPPEPEHGHRTGPGAGSYRGAVGGPGNGKMGGEWGVGVDTYDTYTRSKNWIGILKYIFVIICIPNVFAILMKFSIRKRKRRVFNIGHGKGKGKHPNFKQRKTNLEKNRDFMGFLQISGDIIYVFLRLPFCRRITHMNYGEQGRNRCLFFSLVSESLAGRFPNRVWTIQDFICFGNLQETQYSKSFFPLGKIVIHIYIHKHINRMN